MKVIAKIFILILTLAFLWIMIVTINSIKPKRIANRFQICDINNISSWGAIQGEIKKITSIKTPPGKPEDHIELIFNNPAHDPYFSCKYLIPETILFRALTINVRYKVNQTAQIHIGMHRVGQGPGWESILVDKESVDKIITGTWSIDKPTDNEPKLNWLSGPYEEVTFGISNFDRLKPLILTIYEVYLE